MDVTELKQIMRSVGLNSSELSRVIGIHKTTFQRYVDGSAKIPAKIVSQIRDYQEHDAKVMSNLMVNVNQFIDKQFPFGIQTHAEPGEL